MEPTYLHSEVLRVATPFRRNEHVSITEEFDLRAVVFDPVTETHVRLDNNNLRFMINTIPHVRRLNIHVTLWNRNSPGLSLILTELPRILKKCGGGIKYLQICGDGLAEIIDVEDAAKIVVECLDNIPNGLRNSFRYRYFSNSTPLKKKVREMMVYKYTIEKPTKHLSNILLKRCPSNIGDDPSKLFNIMRETDILFSRQISGKRKRGNRKKVGKKYWGGRKYSRELRFPDSDDGEKHDVISLLSNGADGEKPEVISLLSDEEDNKGREVISLLTDNEEEGVGL
jgi:hypothetical protein